MRSGSSLGRRALVAAATILMGLPCLLLATFRVAAVLREGETNAAAAPKTGRFVRAADVDLFVQEEGPADGPPVLFIHGTGAWSEIWRGTMHALAAQGYRAIAVDMPPFGYTSRPASPNYGDDAQARRILGALDALQLEQVTLVGHSFGARSTMQAVFLAPARVRALVLVDAALGLSAAPTAPGRPVRALLATSPVRNALVATTLTNPMFTARLLSGLVAEKSAVTPERVRMLQRPFVVENTTVRFGEWLRPFVTSTEGSLATRRDLYGTLRMPALVLWGARDSLTPLAQGRDLVGLIPGARWAELPRAGHIPAIEDPAGFDDALLRFLRDNVTQVTPHD